MRTPRPGAASCRSPTSRASGVRSAALVGLSDRMNSPPQPAAVGAGGPFAPLPIGTALLGRTWQSIVPELVPRGDLKSAVALNSLGVNIARAIGPALGGVVLAAFGAAVTYGADSLSYVFVVAALVWWRRSPRVDD